MGCQLSVENAKNLVVTELGFDKADIQGWQRKNGYVECVALVNQKWLKELENENYTLPDAYPSSCYERFLYLQQSNHEIPKPWTRVIIKIFKKPLKTLCVPKTLKSSSFPYTDTFADLMSYVSTENFKNYLIQARKKYSSTPVSGDIEVQERKGKEILQSICEKWLKIKIIKLHDEPSTEQDKRKSSTFERTKRDLYDLESERRFSGIQGIHGILESENCYFILECYSPHTLQDVAWFSPSVISSTITKPLFLFYQILRMFESFHDMGYYCGVYSLENIKLNNCLWLSSSLSYINFDGVKDDIKNNGKSTNLNKKELLSDGAVHEENLHNAISLRELVDKWVKKEVSNFDYLMALNSIAGRRLGDPNYHPVLPWVTDFTTPCGKYRDLTKSKFRINKGDSQLDVTFKNVLYSDDGDHMENPPHHVSGVLSEITYHVYLARRTPKNVLTKHVRAKWEPNEYPCNMERLQEWTPDECIPEFYTDPTIFKSIHPDLPDLGVPAWADNPQDFIGLHRKALESDYVCDHLHHWIDLTFGYKLVGSAAEKAKNVYLHLVDQHQTISNHGVVQLFIQPHPKQIRHHQMDLYPTMVNLDDELEQEILGVNSDGQRVFVEESQNGFEVLHTSWEDVDGEMKNETTEDESGSQKKQKTWQRTNLTSFLRLKDNVDSSTDVVPSIDSLPISLAIGYGPLEEFNQVELLTKFKLQAKENTVSYAKDLSTYSEVAILPRSEIPETARHREIQNICTMLVEMFLPGKMRLLSPAMTQKERFITAKRIFSSTKMAVPSVLRDGMKTLFDEGCGFNKRQGLPPLTPELLLQGHVAIFPFPSCFKQFYEFLVEFHLGSPSEENCLKQSKTAVTSPRNGVSYTIEQVHIAVKYLPDLVDELNSEGLELLISYLIPLFSCEQTQLQAFLHLFDPIAAFLGPRQTKRTFLKKLLQHYDVKKSNASFLLFHQSFLSKIIMRFGMEPFLDHFLTLIVDALNLSDNDMQVNADTCSQDEAPGVLTEDERKINLNHGHSLDYENNSNDIESESLKDVLGDVDGHDLDWKNREGELFPITENDKGDFGVLSGESQDLNDVDSHGMFNYEINDDFSKFDRYGDDDDEELESIERNDAIFHKSFATVSRPGSDEDWDGVAATDFSFERSLSFNSERVDDDQKDISMDSGEVSASEISEAAADSICWLAPRLGPLLTSNHIIKPLLGMLANCYVGVVAMGDKGMAVGKSNAKWILHCLAFCTKVYGDAIIFDQYLPFVSSKVNISSSRVSVKGEASMAASLVLVHQYISLFSEFSLLQRFEILCSQPLHQVLCLICSPSISFSSEKHARLFMALLILDIFKLVCEILERHSAQDMLSLLINTFFSCFEPLDESALEQPGAKEICETFDAALAYHAYIPLCKCLGDTYIETTLDKNNDLVWQLCCSVDTGLSNQMPPNSQMQSMFISSEDGNVNTKKGEVFDVESRNESKSLSLDRSFAASSQIKTRTKDISVSSRQHLAGNWLKYWKNHLGKRKQVDGNTFSQLRLQTFAGHSDVVKDIHIQDNEHLFLSASRDKTVKLWLLNNYGDGTGQSASSWTACDHRKSVFAVDVIDVMRQAVSCDGSIHIWDLPTGSSVLRLKFPKSNEALSMATLPSPSPCIVAGMQNGTVRMIDIRQGNFGHMWRVATNSSAGYIRCLCVTPDGTSMAIGFASGFMSIIDLRGGILTRQWKAHETDILQIQPYTNTSFVTSSSSQKMKLWDQDAVRLWTLPTITGSGETVQNIHIHDKVIVSLAGNNRIGWHTITDSEPSYTHIRLRNDVFKGNSTCFGVLPLNRAYLFGGEDGNITLMG